MNDEDFLGDSFEQLIKSKAIVPRQTIHPFNHESDDEDEEFPDDLTDAQKYEIMKKSPEIVNFINELESKTSLIQELEFIINENATSIFERPAEFILLKYRILN